MRLRIRTQQGRAKDLLQNLVKWVGEEALNCGCKDVIAEQMDEWKPVFPRDPSARRNWNMVEMNVRNPRPATDWIESPEDGRFHPAFDVPPRAAETTYCVSYAWTDESSKTVDRICADALSRGIEIIRDKTHLGLGERISKFMQRLAKGDRIFVILSARYLQSPYCMFELFEIWRQCKLEDKEFLKRIRVFRLPDAKIGSIIERAQVGIYWKQQFEQIDELIKEHGGGIIGGEDFSRYKLMRDFALHVGDILSLVMDTLQPTTIEQLEDFGFVNE
jgi:internalin A